MCLAVVIYKCSNEINFLRAENMLNVVSEHGGKTTQNVINMLSKIQDSEHNELSNSQACGVTNFIMSNFILT